MNPTFRHIDFSACGPAITRLSRLTLRVWAKSLKGQQWRQLLELSLALQGLQYLGRSVRVRDFPGVWQHRLIDRQLDRMHQPLPQNAVIFHLTDGVYTSFTSLTDYVPAPVAAPARANSSRVLPTASFDALLRLAKLDDSIQDALATRDKLAADLENLLQTNKHALDDRDRVAEGEDRLKTIDFAKKVVEKQLDKARKQQEEKKASLKNRRQLMKEDTQRRHVSNERMQSSRPELPNIRDEHEIKRKAIDNQRRRVCQDIQACYPINPIPKQSLSFTVRDLHLPNSDDLDTSSPDAVAAALGHTAHVVSTLSHYLSQPLVYPLHLRGSTSTISDTISLLKTAASTTQRYSDEVALRTYPLYSRGVPRFRFEYAVFLLNKDIQLLLETVYAIRVLDIRHTLPNLKYLLYVATAGEGELPARKAGGVRGLLRVKGEGRPHGSRSGSEGSTNSALSGILWHGGTTNANGKAKGAVESLRRNMGKA